MRLVPVAAAARLSSLSGWTVVSGGRQFGPLSEEELRRFFSSGLVKHGDVLVHREHEGGLPAEDVAARFALSAPRPAAAIVLEAEPPVRLLSMAPNVPSSRRAMLLALLAFMLGVFTWAVPEPRAALDYARQLAQDIRTP